MAEQSAKMTLPGDASPCRRIARMLRVNHAGEYGARRIYEGQLKVLGGTAYAPLLKEMAEQEKVHLQYFSSELPKRQIRPTLLQPLWHVAGYALGVVTAKMGPRTAMACTVAVEEVIAEHYAAQEEELAALDPALKGKIAEFRADETAHRDTGIEQQAELAPGYEIVTAFIKAGSKAAIWLSKRI